jgi:hypothetical protein
VSVSAFIRAAVERGLTYEQALIAAEALESTMPSVQVEARSNAAIRQARYRQRKASQTVTDHNETVTHRNEASQSVTLVSPPSSPPFLSPKPPIQSPPISPPSGSFEGADASEKPQSEAIPPQDQSEKLAKAKAMLADFNAFWSAYPNKTGKPVASKAYLGARLGTPVHGNKRTPADHDTIMAGLSRYVATKPPDRSWLNPSTFLNQERYHDEPASPSNPHPRTGNTATVQAAPFGNRPAGGSLADAGLRLVQEISAQRRSAPTMAGQAVDPW